VSPLDRVIVAVAVLAIAGSFFVDGWASFALAAVGLAAAVVGAIRSRRDHERGL